MNCPHCPKVTKNHGGLLRHIRAMHPETVESDSDQASSVSSEVDMIKPEPSERMVATKRLMTTLASGTEVLGHVQDAVTCGVCSLQVEKTAYGGHLSAHVEAVKLQYAYLGEVLERTAASVRSLTS